MNRLEYRFGSNVAIKDTTAYQEYIKFINGYDSNKSLTAAANALQITSMNEIVVQDMMHTYSIEYNI